MARLSRSRALSNVYLAVYSQGLGAYDVASALGVSQSYAYTLLECLVGWGAVVKVLSDTLVCADGSLRYRYTYHACDIDSLFADDSLPFLRSLSHRDYQLFDIFRSFALNSLGG